MKLFAFLVAIFFSCISHAALELRPLPFSDHAITADDVLLARTQLSNTRDSKVLVVNEPRDSLGLPGHPFSLVGNASFLGLAAPRKYGLALTFRTESKWALEMSFFQGHYDLGNRYFDIGDFHESLYNIDLRYFVWHSLNFIIGLDRQVYRANISADLLNRAGVTDTSSFDLVRITTLGLQLGISNRWSAKRFVFGVDWLVINIPFQTIDNEAPVLHVIGDSDLRSKIDRSVSWMRYIPTFSLAKIALGFDF